MQQNCFLKLLLKAALLKRGFSDKDLKKYDYRHNLAALLKEIQNKGVPVTQDTISVVQGLSSQHLTHQLRYTILADGMIKLCSYWPPLSLVFRALDELLGLARISTHGI